MSYYLMHQAVQRYGLVAFLFYLTFNPLKTSILKTSSLKKHQAVQRYGLVAFFQTYLLFNSLKTLPAAGWLKTLPSRQAGSILKTS